MYKRYLLSIVAILVLSLTFTLAMPGFMGPSRAYAAQAAQYTVKSGDSLYLIAKKYNVTIDGLKAANSLKTDMIYPGQVLAIPGNPAGTSGYTVKSGDTLYLIARAYGITVSDLKSSNGLTSDMIYPGQKLTIPAAGVKSLRDILSANGLLYQGVRLDILVDKSDHTLTIMYQGRPLKSYHVELGDGGPGDKAVSGDHKTPEGSFYISQKSMLSPADPYLGTRWMRLSYPNAEDAARGLQQGIIDKAAYDAIVSANNKGQIPPQNTALGGGVGIHGGSTAALGSDWTWGCVGLSNKDVEDFYDYVNVGTRVTIRK